MRSHGPLILAAALGACSLPNFAAPPPPAISLAADCRVSTPFRYAHWADAIGTRVMRVRETLDPALARWPAVPRSAARIEVCSDSAEAAVFLAKEGLRGDPRVPRTFPARALVVLPLPRNDTLLAEQPAPPQTWMQSLGHEAAHLVMAEHPDLAAAPRWFLEGLAEAWREGAPDPAAHAWMLPLPAAGAVPSEQALDAWAAAALYALDADPGPRPWEAALPAVAPEFAAPRAPWHRGREAHADAEAGLYLAATLPGEIVEVDLPALAPGERRAWSLRLGTSGAPDAGLLLRPRSGAAMRLRCDAAGGLAAWMEDPARPGRSESSDRAGALPSAAPREFILEHCGGEILIQSQSFVRRLPIQPEARAYPVALILYVRDGVCAARATP